MEIILKKVTDNLLEYLSEKHGYKVPASEINTGFCYIWALFVRYHIPHAKLFSYNRLGGHAFIMIDGLYYDSEHLNGVSDWKQLNFFAFQNPKDEYLLPHSIGTFMINWGVKIKYFRNILWQCNLNKRESVYVTI